MQSWTVRSSMPGAMIARNVSIGACGRFPTGSMRRVWLMMIS
jgi:hypothetical protein